MEQSPPRTCINVHFLFNLPFVAFQRIAEIWSFPAVLIARRERHVGRQSPFRNPASSGSPAPANGDSVLAMRPIRELFTNVPTPHMRYSQNRE
jgi:hypothetical protein